MVTGIASFLLIAALNPCPCGFFGDKKRMCLCSRQQIEKYLSKLSGPLLDRIDIQIPIQSVEYETIHDKTKAPISSEELYAKVTQACALQQQRFGTDTIHNATMSSDLIEIHCKVSDEAEQLVKRAFNRLHLSMRGYHKLLKVARTIADLDNQEVIQADHIKESIIYRCLDQTLERMKQQ